MRTLKLLQPRGASRPQQPGVTPADRQLVAKLLHRLNDAAITTVDQLEIAPGVVPPAASPLARAYPTGTRTGSVSRGGWQTTEDASAEALKTWKETAGGHAAQGYPLDVGIPGLSPGFQVHSSLDDGTLSVEGLLDSFQHFAGGRSLLAAADVHIERSSIGLVSRQDWNAFSDFMEKATGAPPRLDAAVHELWVRDQGGVRVTFLVPEHQADKPTDVIAAIRERLGFRDVDHASQTPVDQVLSYVSLCLAQPPRTTAAGRVRALRKLMDHVLTSDVSNPKVVAVYSFLADRIRQERTQPGPTGKIEQHESRLAVPLQWFFPEVARVEQQIAELETKVESPAATPLECLELAKARAQLARYHATDDRLIDRNLEVAIRRQKLRSVVAAAGTGRLSSGKPAWFEALKTRMPGHIEASWRSFIPLEYATMQNKPTDPTIAAATEKLVERGNDRVAFTAWLDGLMDEVAERAESSQDPVVRSQWARKQLPPAVLQEIIEDRALKQGWSGLHTIRATDGILTVHDFGQIMEDQKLVVDPFFTVDQHWGPKGRLSAPLVWLYLSDGHPEARDVYTYAGTDLKRGKEAREQFCAELTEMMGDHDWPMARVSITPMIDGLVPLE